MGLLERLQNIPSGVSVTISGNDLKELFSYAMSEVKSEIVEVINKTKQDRYVPKKEAAEMLNITTVTLSSWLKSDDYKPLKKYKNGRKVYLKLSDIEAFKNRKQHETL